MISMNSTEGILERCFPDNGNRFDAIVRYIRSLKTDAGLSEEDISAIRSVGRNTAGIRMLSESLSSGQILAMEYLGPVTPHSPFDQRLCETCLAGPDLSVIVLTDTEGVPCGIIPLEQFTDRTSAFVSMKNSRCLIVTDTILYSYENLRALEISECDYILRMRQFPISFGPSSGQKVLPLRHNGKEYCACKCRYDKKWLFKFVDEKDTESVRTAVSCMDLREQDSQFFTKSAGHEHAVSDVGHDIREVRDLIDARMHMDRVMGVCRIMLSSDDRLLYDRDAMVGFVLAFVLGQRPEFG